MNGTDFNQSNFDDFLSRLIEIQSAQTAALARIAQAIETIAMSNAPEPRLTRALSEYADFDPASIGAVGKERDKYGWTVLEWGGYDWKRRSPSNNFAEAIYFSRPIGKKPDGTNNYARLITFKELGKVKPISREAEALVEHKPAAAPKPEEPEAPVSELDRIFGPNPRAAVAPRADVAPRAETWPTNQAEFETWLKARQWNGKEIHSALRNDLKGWLKLNAGQTIADAAKEIAAVMGKS